MNNTREIEILAEFAQDNIVFTENDSDKIVMSEIAQHFHKLKQISDFGLKVDGLPDLILELPDKVILLDLFRFDASESCDYGSMHQYQLNKRNVEWNSKMKTLSPDSPELHVTSDIGCKYTLQGYLTNLERVFMSHYRKIDQYISSSIQAGLIKDDTIIEIGFVIIEDTILGSYYFDDDNEMQSLTIVRTPEFYDLLLQSPRLNYVFTGVNNGSKQGLFFYVNSDSSRKFYRDRVIDFAKNRYFAFEPKEARIGSFIPTDPKIK